ncbi:MAG: SLC13 family permease [Desulfobacteraceae bacterium]|jgi:sodium-dependent dicarboxylate transporter 2/3/5
MSGNNISLKKGDFQNTGLFLGPFLFILILLINPSPENPMAEKMAAIAALMAAWWITEAIPLAATSLLPLVLYPIMGIMKGKSTAPIYINSTIFLFIGGFIIAIAMEKWRLHKRIALRIIGIIGGSPSTIILGFMISAAFLSMWISNTATAIMMVPIGMSIISQMEEKFGEKDACKFTITLMLGIAYACSIGGIATLVGTPPNLSFARIFEITFPNAEPVVFGQWFIMALPLTIIMLAIIWILLTKVFYNFPAHLKADKQIVHSEYKNLGPMSFEEKAVTVVFISAALLWIFRKEINIGLITIPGWSQLLPYPDLIDDGTVAVFMAMILFIIPSRDKSSGNDAIIDVKVFKAIPWHIVLLFGGGFALAKGFQVTGLSALVGEQFKGLAGTSPYLIVTVTCTAITFLTELTSNTATTEMILPILASVAVAVKTNPLLLMIPATLSASCAFMMPVATPPNAIVFGSGKIRIIDMVKVGIFINIVGIIVIGALFYFFGTIIFSIDPGVIPEWATIKTG